MSFCVTLSFFLCRWHLLLRGQRQPPGYGTTQVYDSTTKKFPSRVDKNRNIKRRKDEKKRDWSICQLSKWGEDMSLRNTDEINQITNILRLRYDYESCISNSNATDRQTDLLAGAGWSVWIKYVYEMIRYLPPGCRCFPSTRLKRTPNYIHKKKTEHFDKQAKMKHRSNGCQLA